MPYKIPKVARLGNAGAGGAREGVDVPAVDDVEASAAERRSFRSLSAVLSGFTELELEATGVEDLYLGFLLAKFRDVLDELLLVWAAIERVS